ncbi:MAG: ATP-binding protein [Anaerolineales bacterium]
MSDELKGILKKIEENTTTQNTPTPSSVEAGSHLRQQPVGDPNCPHCHGLGYLRADLPLGHPDFGKLQICSCRRGEVALHSRRRLYAISRLEELKDLTFDNFEPRGRVGLPPRQADSLEAAYNQARQFSQKMEGWLLLEGGYGSGKTHLAAAIANFAVSVGLPAIFITVPDLLDALRFSYSSEDGFEERFEEIRQAPLLILDDFGTQNATEWAQEKLFQILNHRYINRLPLVITTNLSLEQIEGRIRSRLSDPELVTRLRILAPDFRRPTDDTSQNELSDLHLLRDKNFANFELRDGEGLTKQDLTALKKAFEGARKYAEKPKGWLVFTGSHGSGKTHLAAAIANYAQDMGRIPVFVTVPDLLDHLRATFNPNSPVSYDRRFEELRNSELLILDDLGTQSATPWAREKLYQLFTHRYNAQLPTVITTADTLDEMDPRILSRIRDARLSTNYPIGAPAYTGKKK